MFILRDYQTETVDRSVAFLTDGTMDNGLVVLPTGSGKSLVIAALAKAMGQPCLVFQPSKEILEQNYAKFLSYGIRPAIYSASAGRKEVGEITLATIGSVKGKPELFTHSKYCIIDECHFNLNPKAGMFKAFLESLAGVRVIGFTATPYRLVTDGFGGSILKFLTRTRPRVFHRVIHHVQNGDLFNAGHLARLDYKQVKTGFDKQRLRLNTTGADYTDVSVRRHFDELGFKDQIVRCVERLHELNRDGALVFTRFVEEARYVAQRVPGARIVTAQTPRVEREEIVAGFKAGRIPVVTNCAVFLYGFDYPELANVILASPTMSLARYYQQVGRCVRPHPDKRDAFVIDMVGLVEQFGKVEDLKLECGPHETWYVSSNGRQLTNVYY